MLSPPPFFEVRSPTTESSSSSRRSVHKLPLANRDGRGKPYLVLVLLSSATSAKHQPLFFERDIVEGSVFLELGKAEYVQAVKIVVKGKIITGSALNPYSLTFLEFSHTVWDREMGDPQGLPALSTSAPTKFNGKLPLGEYTWPFSFPFPGPSSFTLPGYQASHLLHTFLERDLNGNIQYELVLCVLRGKFKANTKIRTMAAHIPRVMTKSPLPVRQQSYLGNTPLHGPEDDREGWLTLRPTIMHGQVFNKRLAEIKRILSLSQPLSYTRGTVIPCHITMMSLDTQTLDLLASSQSINVCLRRKVNFYLVTSSGRKNRKYVPMQELVDDVEVAVWRPLKGSSDSESRLRRSEGEIHLYKDLYPSSDFDLVTIEYSVVLLPFMATGFTALSAEIPLSQPVEITTEHAPGSRPIRYLPPLIDTERKDRLKRLAQQSTEDEVDFMMKIGSFNGLGSFNGWRT